MRKQPCCFFMVMPGIFLIVLNQFPYFMTSVYQFSLSITADTVKVMGDLLSTGHTRMQWPPGIIWLMNANYTRMRSSYSGRSLGGAVAASLAAKIRPAAVILESTFTSIKELGKYYYPYLPVSWISRIHYPVDKHITAFNCPVLIIHSHHDELIPDEIRTTTVSKRAGTENVSLYFRGS